MPISARKAPGGETYRAGTPVLGARLAAAAALVRPGLAAADIGTDHGKLAVWLALSGTSPAVIAVDIRPMPLARARALAAQAGCVGRVHCRLGKGLAPLAPFEAQEIVVAGLSGETTIEILQGCSWLFESACTPTAFTCCGEGVHLVLVPATRHHRLRRWLCRAGFHILRETVALEKGRSYAALSVCHTGHRTEPDELFCQLGLVPQSPGPAAAAYIAARLEDLKNQSLSPMAACARRRHEQLTGEVEACLQRCR